MLSVSTDGKVLLWEIKLEDKPSLLTHPVKGYLLLIKREGAIAGVGGLCFSQSFEDKSTFIIGSEAGSVLKATIANNLGDKKNKVLLE